MGRTYVRSAVEKSSGVALKQYRIRPLRNSDAMVSNSCNRGPKDPRGWRWCSHF